MKKITKLIAVAMTAVTVAGVAVATPVTVKADAVQDALALQQQQILLLQQAQQQAMLDQYQKALLVYQEAIANQQRAIQQAYMLNSVTALQQAQYNNLVNKTVNGAYQGYILEDYAKYQQQAMQAYLTYFGLK